MPYKNRNSNFTQFSRKGCALYEGELQLLEKLLYYKHEKYTGKFDFLFPSLNFIYRDLIKFHPQSSTAKNCFLGIHTLGLQSDARNRQFFYAFSLF